MPPSLKPGYDAADGIFGQWLDWKIASIRKVDPNRLITVGHNAQHALLASNSKLDFVSHHSYPASPPYNMTCTYASFDNCSALSGSVAIMDRVWIAEGKPRPVTLGEFGTRTTRDLWPLYGKRVGPQLLAGGASARLASASPLSSSSSPACVLPDDCVAGIVSTFGWFDTHNPGMSCQDKWSQAVGSNAGPASIHHRCPASAGTGDDAWHSATYTACWSKIEAAGVGASVPVCTPPADPTPCNALSFAASAVWDLTVWLRAIASGTDGALRWTLAEKSYVNAVLSDTWTGSDQTPKAHDMYVSGSKWGLYWYDGTPLGRPKPIIHATRFLAEHMVAVGDVVWGDAAAHTLQLYEDASTGPNSVDVAYTFTGPGCLFVGGRGQQTAGAAVNFTAASGGPANIMLSWDLPSSLSDAAVVRVMATNDAAAEIRLGSELGCGALSDAWHAEGNRSAITVTTRMPHVVVHVLELLAGEVVTLRKPFCT